MEHPAKAAKYFLTFLKIAGFSLEDLQDSGWRKITDDEWSHIVKGDAGEDREKWLPRILEIFPASGSPMQPALIKQDVWKKFLKTACPEGIV